MSPNSPASIPSFNAEGAAVRLASAVPDDFSDLNELDAPPPAPSKPRFEAIGLIAPLVTFALFVAFWEYMHRDGMRRLFDKPGILVPSPATMIDKALGNAQVRRQLVVGLGWTSFAALVGLLITIVIGLAIAVLMSQARWAERAMYPYLVALQAVPVLAIVPLILSVFGPGMGSRIFVCVMISFFPIVTNSLFGLTSAEPGQHDLFTLRGASRWTRLFKLQFPAAMPAIFTGFRISAGLSVIGAIVGEQFFRQGDKPGLGVVMEQMRQKSRFPEQYAGLLVSSLLGIAVFFLFGFIANLVVGRWYEAVRRTK